MNLPEPFHFSQFEIILTRDCNLNCSYCYERKNKQTVTCKEASVKDICSFVSKAADTQAENVRLQFFGGEPLLRFAKIQQIVSEIENIFAKTHPQINLAYGLTTNLTTATAEQILFLAERRFDILVSLDGKQEDQDKNRGTGSFEKVIQRIARLNSLGASVQLRMTVTKNTLKNFSANIRFVNSLGFPFSWELDLQQEYLAEELLGLAENLDAFYRGTQQVNDLTIQRIKDRAGRAGYCINPYETVSISPEGQLIICSRADLVIGDIWQGITAGENIKQLPIYGGAPRPECRECTAYEICKGGCLGEHWAGAESQNIEYVNNPRFCQTQRILYNKLKEKADEYINHHRM